ncbi:MAG TPA: response regulator, partial [Gammaproteobacteria bacterium]|nr:response regulator [Gammaproteobacteria bacterium]
MTPEGMRPTVFVVDDDPDVLDSVRWLLHQAGFQVEAFDAPDQFLATFREGAGDCLVLDLRMPTMDGLTVQQELIRLGAEIPIIFISAHGDIPQTVRAMHQGAWDFIEKPFDPHRLVESVQGALNWSRLRR